MSTTVLNKLVMVANGMMDWDDEKDGARCIIFGKPLTRKLAMKLLQEDLEGAFIPAIRAERNEYFFKKYQERVCKASVNEFSLVQEAEDLH